MHRTTIAPALLAALAAAAAPARAQVTSLVSIAENGTQSDADVMPGDVSNDGRFVVFTTTSKKLVPGTTTSKQHVYLVDRATGAVELISVGNDGAEANQDALRPRISGDGRWVVFETLASNLDQDDTNGRLDCYLYDRDEEWLERVSLGANDGEGNGDSFRPVVSDDGDWILFSSFANNLITGDDNGTADVFIRDRQTGTTRLVSSALDGTVASDYSEAADLSADGRYALFQSAAKDMVAGSIAGWNKIMLRDLQLGVTEQASLQSDGLFPAGECRFARMSADARWITFASSVHTIVPGDSNQREDVFLRDRQLATTERVNIGPNGEQDDVGGSYARPSDDGRFILFESSATVFAPSDTNDNGDVFLRDRRRATTRHVSLSTDGKSSKLGCGEISISGDGHVLLFRAGGDELDPADHNGRLDAYVHDRGPADASVASYGSGHPGRYGVPTATLQDDPVIGGPVDLVVTNSSGAWTLGFLLLGEEPLALPAGWGGELLVAPLVAIPIPLPPGSYTLHDEIGYEADFWGVVEYLQVLELDPWASEGISSTAGLELVFGT